METCWTTLSDFCHPGCLQCRTGSLMCHLQMSGGSRWVLWGAVSGESTHTWAVPMLTAWLCDVSQVGQYKSFYKNFMTTDIRVTGLESLEGFLETGNTVEYLKQEGTSHSFRGLSEDGGPPGHRRLPDNRVTVWATHPPDIFKWGGQLGRVSWLQEVQLAVWFLRWRKWWV